MNKKYTLSESLIVKKQLFEAHINRNPSINYFSKLIKPGHTYKEHDFNELTDYLLSFLRAGVIDKTTCEELAFWLWRQLSSLFKFSYFRKCLVYRKDLENSMRGYVVILGCLLLCLYGTGYTKSFGFHSEYEISLVNGKNCFQDSIEKVCDESKTYELERYSGFPTTTREFELGKIVFDVIMNLVIGLPTILSLGFNLTCIETKQKKQDACKKHKVLSLDSSLSKLSTKYLCSDSGLKNSSLSDDKNVNSDLNEYTRKVPSSIEIVEECLDTSNYMNVNKAFNETKSNMKDSVSTKYWVKGSLFDKTPKYSSDYFRSPESNISSLGDGLDMYSSNNMNVNKVISETKPDMKDSLLTKYWHLENLEKTIFEYSPNDIDSPDSGISSLGHSSDTFSFDNVSVNHFKSGTKSNINGFVSTKYWHEQNPFDKNILGYSSNDIGSLDSGISSLGDGSETFSFDNESVNQAIGETKSNINDYILMKYLPEQVPFFRDFSNEIVSPDSGISFLGEYSDGIEYDNRGKVQPCSSTDLSVHKKSDFGTNFSYYSSLRVNKCYPPCFKNDCLCCEVYKIVLRMTPEPKKIYGNYGIEKSEQLNENSMESKKVYGNNISCVFCKSVVKLNGILFNCNHYFCFTCIPGPNKKYGVCKHMSDCPACNVSTNEKLRKTEKENLKLRKSSATEDIKTKVLHDWWSGNVWNQNLNETVEKLCTNILDYQNDFARYTSNARSEYQKWLKSM